MINADESEPGTCKDRLLMEYDPHQMIEGILIAGLALDAHKGYLYIRGEYRYLIDHMDRAIAEAYAQGYLGKNILGTGFDFDLYTHSGAGAYECGEETSLLDSLEEDARHAAPEASSSGCCRACGPVRRCLITSRPSARFRRSFAMAARRSRRSVRLRTAARGCCASRDT